MTEDIIEHKIKTVAYNLFKENGYAGLSMRVLAKEVGVSVGGLYNYYSSKDKLFFAVVQPAITLLDVVTQKHYAVRNNIVNFSFDHMETELLIDEYVSLIIDNKMLFDLLFFKSKGSSLETFRENYTLALSETTYTWYQELQKKYQTIVCPVNQFTTHLHAIYLMMTFEEIISHNVSPENIRIVVRDYIFHEAYDWKQLNKMIMSTKNK